MVIAAGGLSLRKAVKALWLVRRGSTPEESTVAYESGNGVIVLVVLLSGAVELLLVDVLLSVLWMRLLALTLGLLGVIALLAFLAALRAYPHRAAKGALTIYCGACFELAIPLGLVDSVVERRRMINQTHIAEVSHGVLSVPVNGFTNLVITLNSPVKVQLKKAALAEVREIQVFALDPGSGTQKLRNGVPVGHDDDVDDVVPARRLLRARLLRWAGPLVLLGETAIVTVDVTLVENGRLDWRAAAGVFVVAEATLALLGGVGAVSVTEYRRRRAEAADRTLAGWEG